MKLRFACCLMLGLWWAAPIAYALNCTRAGILPGNPDSAYTVHGDGTVTHVPTGLMWKRCSEGQTWNGSTCSGSQSVITWPSALALARVSSFAGHSDWRLPNLKELRSLVEECRYIPAVNDTIFPSAPSSPFWSGSPNASNSISAWYVNFFNGNAGNEAYRYSSLAVRLVRGGQSFGSFDAYAGGVAVPACTSITPSNSQLVLGSGSPLMTASCSNSPTSYVWKLGTNTLGGCTGATCTVPASSLPSVGVYSLSVTANNAGGTGTQAASGTITVTAGGTIDLSSLSGSTGSEQYYALNVPANASNLVIQTSGGTGNVDLYVRANAWPTTAAYDCRSIASGNTEVCSFAAPQLATYYILLYGSSVYSGARLTASYTTTVTSPACTLTASPATIRKNGAATLTASCSPTASAYAWTGGTCAGNTTATCTVAPTVTSTYTVRGSNTSGAGAPASATVTVKSVDISPILMLLLD